METERFSFRDLSPLADSYDRFAINDRSKTPTTFASQKYHARSTVFDGILQQASRIQKAIAEKVIKDPIQPSSDANLPSSPSRSPSLTRPNLNRSFNQDSQLDSNSLFFNPNRPLQRSQSALRLNRFFNSQNSHLNSNLSKETKIDPKALMRYNLNQNHSTTPLSESRLQNITIEGLQPNTDETSLKKLLQGCHVVSMDINTNNLTGNCTGSAKVGVRVQPEYKNFQNMKLKCIEKGLSVKSQKNQIGKRNNYVELSNRDFLDCLIQQEVSRLSKKYTSPRVNQAHLMSSEDAYGSSPGTGRRPASSKRAIQVEQKSFLSWDRVRNTPLATKRVAAVKSSQNFMRSTLSSLRKNKQLIMRNLEPSTV